MILVLICDFLVLICYFRQPYRAQLIEERKAQEAQARIEKMQSKAEKKAEEKGAPVNHEPRTLNVVIPHLPKVSPAFVPRPIAP